MKYKVAVIGAGWVGKGMVDLFPDAVVYVRDTKKYQSLFSLRTLLTSNKEDVNACDIAFVCVPTPLKDDDTLDTSIVESIVAWCEASVIVIRSTVNPGDCHRWEKLYDKNIVFQPEYLGETPSHPLLDTKQTQFLIIGGQPTWRRKLIDLYTTVYNANVTIRQVMSLEAEIIKLSENRAIAFKVMQCQELYRVCEAAGINYYTIRDAVYGDDPRFNLWFSFIFKDNLGFQSSKCLKKDVPAFCAWARSVGMTAEITEKLVRESVVYAGGQNPQIA